MRIAYVLTSLGVGGAERLVLDLASRMEKRGHSVSILVLLPQIAEQWPTAFPVVYLGIRRRPFSVVAGLLRARRSLQEFHPDLVHSHCFHPNILVRLLKFCIPSAVVLSTVHNAYEGGWHRMWAYRLTDALSRQTTAVSQAAADRFLRLKAIPKHKCTVVTNGIDITKFAPEAGRRERLRAEMGARKEFIWLAAGRIVPAKDIPNLLRAFSMTRSTHPAQNAVFALDHGWQFRQVTGQSAGCRSWLAPRHRSRRCAPRPARQQEDPDPFFRDNESKLQWIENESWEYRLNFDVTPALLARSNVDLVFDGLDAAAQVYLNGTRCSREQHVPHLARARKGSSACRQESAARCLSIAHQGRAGRGGARSLAAAHKDRSQNLHPQSRL
jgi:hypothetical protein